MNDIYMCQQLINYTGDVENQIFIGYSLTGQIVYIEEWFYSDEPDWTAGCIQLAVLEITDREYINLKRLKK